MAISKFNYNSFNVTPVAGKALSFNSNADGFSTAGASSMILIKTLTASSSATLSFVNGSSDVVLDSTYPIYKFQFINMHPATNSATFEFNMSADTGSNYNVTKTTTFADAVHQENDGNPGLAISGGRDLAQATGFQDIMGGIGSDNDEAGSGELWLFNPSSTTFVKHFLSTSNHVNGDATSPYSIYNFGSGYGNTTSAVDAIQFQFHTGNIDAGVIKLYGISDS